MSHDHPIGAAECREIFARLSEYLDGELDPEICSHLEGHLGDCPPCQVFLESLRRTVGLVGGIPAPKLPDEMRRNVLEAWERLCREGRGD